MFNLNLFRSPNVKINQPVSTIKPVDDKFEKYAYIDWRYEAPATDVTLLGHKVDSFANTKLMVDQLKRNGFNGIVLNTNLPIDPNTGEAKFIDDRPGFNNINKSLPKDTWRVVQYAKQQKLDVTINFNIVDYRNDNPLQKSNVGENFDTKKFFKAVANYESNIAVLAQRHKVDAIGIGTYQNGFDSLEHKADWQNVISQVKSKFKGSLTYTSSGTSDNAVFGMVDVINVSRGNTTDNNAVLEQIKELSNKYKKPVQLSPIFAGAAESNVDPWTMLNNNQSLDSVQHRPDLQADKIREILKAAIIDQPKGLSGVAFYEFAPWAQAAWIKNPQNEIGQQFKQARQLGSAFEDNPTAADTFKNWFNYSTKDIIGNNRNNTLETFAGNKMIDGKDGRDTLIVHNSIDNCKIVKDKVNGGFDVYNGVNGVDGVYDMYNVEFVKFNDATVSLIGNYDLSKFGWF